jgi:hypothetical protein
MLEAQPKQLEVPERLPPWLAQNLTRTSKLHPLETPETENLPIFRSARMIEVR